LQGDRLGGGDHLQQAALPVAECSKPLAQHVGEPGDVGEPAARAPHAADALKPTGLESPQDQLAQEQDVASCHDPQPMQRRRVDGVESLLEELVDLLPGQGLELEPLDELVLPRDRVRIGDRLAGP